MLLLLLLLFQYGCVENVIIFMLMKLIISLLRILKFASLCSVYGLLFQTQMSIDRSRKINACSFYGGNLSFFLFAYICVERAWLLCYNLALVSPSALLRCILFLWVFYSIKLNLNMESVERTIISQFDALSHQEYMNERMICVVMGWIFVDMWSSVNGRSNYNQIVF